MNNLQELRDTLETIKKYMNDISLDFINDYKNINSSGYINDAMIEHANENVGVYYYEQRDFYNNNVELCSRAFYEDGYDVNEMIQEGYTLDDITCKAGASGWYRQNLEELYEDESEIIKALALQYCIDNNISIDIDCIEYMNVDSTNRFDRIIDEINDAIDEDNNEE